MPEAVPIETRLEGFFRSVLHHLLQSSRLGSDEALEAWKRKSSSTRSGWGWTAEDLQKMFLAWMLGSTVDITMFIDAFDKCESTLAACNLMDLLSKLKEHRDIGQYLSRPRFCISRRRYPNVGTSQPLQIVVERVNEADIMKYVDSSLQTPTGDLHGLSRRITSRSQGIFLWAFLAIQKDKEIQEDGESPNRLQGLSIMCLSVWKNYSRISWTLYHERNPNAASS
ncbi:hypothetical protein AYO20_09094 [Fonsecaea nubica]|uniref:Nephrocystin 3-like N-terminal domain-containing protein n=1 Tax=Fonsecaea nubica TaxID=856822 RepID=A0A178CIB2_9EURO|nr:hypothetical protein AYO20_09094 [Fonsecaea nubica]OAL29710.1 hypothetical protein AYO20_09094 [Fonsecaea nubica]